MLGVPPWLFFKPPKKGTFLKDRQAGVSFFEVGTTQVVASVWSRKTAQISRSSPPPPPPSPKKWRKQGAWGVVC